MQAERAFRCRDPGGLAIAALQPLSWIRTLGIPVLHSGGARSMGHGHTGKVWTEIMGRGDHDGHDGHDGLDEEQAHAQVHRGQQGSVLLRVRGWPEGKNRGILTSVPRDPDPGMPSSKPWADREMPRGSGRQALACLVGSTPQDPMALVPELNAHPAVRTRAQAGRAPANRPTVWLDRGWRGSPRLLSHREGDPWTPLPAHCCCFSLRRYP